MSTNSVFTQAISRHIWDAKYRYRINGDIKDVSIQDTWHRVARALASVETADQLTWEDCFFEILKDFKFLPGGRILAGAGTVHHVTLFNCFVMGTVEDSTDGIFQALKEAAVTMQQGGGIGVDFSTLRPKGSNVQKRDGMASGPVSFMHLWDHMCATLLSTGNRRGAMMATLRCDHPDIEAFINAKKNRQTLRNFNLSVLVSDDFIHAIRKDKEWPLIFPVRPNELHSPQEHGIVHKNWPGNLKPVACKIHRIVRARQLWRQIMQAAYDSAEPGVLFIDRINQANNLYYCETISATNPCGEIPLPAYGACDLGSINLTRFVKQPFCNTAQLDLGAIKEATGIAVRMLDNVIELSRFPLAVQQKVVYASRRIGLGITGLADTLIMLGVRYGAAESFTIAAKLMQVIRDAAYEASIALAQEKGVFPLYQMEKFLQGTFIQQLPQEIQNKIQKYGLRNSHLLAVAPAGTISLLANNISNSLEPIFDVNYERRVITNRGEIEKYRLTNYSVVLWQQVNNLKTLPPAFVSVADISPDAQLEMQAIIQTFVDNAISKTINLPENYPFAAFNTLYEKAYNLGLKGCTAFRPNPTTGAVLYADSQSIQTAHCCDINREAD